MMKLRVAVSRWRAWLTVVCLLTLSHPAHGQTQDPAAAEELFRAGREAMKSGDLAVACDNFRESYRLDPTVGTVLNLAICEERLGRLASAWHRYRQVIEMLRPSDERLVLARQSLAALEPRIPRLTNRLARGAPTGTRVFRDTIELTRASLGVPLPVDPGEHEIIARAEGRQPRRYRVTLSAGEHREVVVARLLLAAAKQSEASPKGPATKASGDLPEDTRDSSGTRVRGFVVGSFGLAALAVSGVTGVMVLDRKNTVEADCNRDTKLCNSREGLDAADSGKTLSAISTTGLAVGVLGVGVGAYLILSSRNGTKVGARWLGTGAGASLGGAF
jgi:hypothetical protein